MEKFVSREGLVAPLDRANVDTDAIIPKQFLKSILRTGYGPNLFDEWRYLDYGEPGADCTKRPLNKDFVLNQPRYQGAQILLARENFGCGSSREHAPWALLQYGFQAVIAPSFADIFYNNSFKNGILCIALPQEQVDALVALAGSGNTAGGEFTVDLAAGEITGPDGSIQRFAIDPARRADLLAGLDEIGHTLTLEHQIAAFERRGGDADRPVDEQRE